ncbi:MAG: oxalate/formate MFS antiporter [SAR324 cluster bacterium]
MQRFASSRWPQLSFGLICMVMIANYQYGWTLFVGPIDAKYGWGRAAIQFAFTLFVLLETWLVPVEGYLVDRFGPRSVVLAGGALCGVSWVIGSVAASLPMLYLAAAIAGIGAGAVYGTCVGNAMKWFPRQRGLAGGLTSAGFGTGAALTVVPISNMIEFSGYESAFLAFGLVQGTVVVLVGLLLCAPDAGSAARTEEVEAAGYGMTPAQTLLHPAFWVMYLMFTMVCTGGLVVVAQLAPIAKDFRVADLPVSLLGITLPALIFALALDRVMNGVTRPILGWLSDGIGRENVMFLAFALEGVGVLALIYLGRNPVGFVLLSGTVFLGWGQIFGLFPAACTDFFGSRYAAANYGLLYTAKGTAAILVPLANVASVRLGSWYPAFWFIAALDLGAAALALLVLRPMRERAQGPRPLPKLTQGGPPPG